MAQDSKSAGKVLTVLKVLLRNFAHGFSAGDLARETGFSPSDITRYVNTLEAAGFAERVVETQRIRPSHNFAQTAVQIMHSLNAAEKKIHESRDRILKGGA